ncbi:hypothetical protein SAMN04487919_1273 [Bacillus sp. ok061]|nr:hypothetical protein SAMN04487919_1273 [Bacillus sp. ok061]
MKKEIKQKFHFVEKWGEKIIMLTWITIGVLIYLVIGIGLLVWSVTTSSWGGLILHFAIPIILFWPYFIIRSLFDR